MALIPPIGTSGIYNLAAPFDTALQANMSYQCDAVRRVDDFVEIGVDPYQEYYVPKGITQEKYDQDVANLVGIVSLVSTAGHWVYVPSTYILAYPDLNGVPYHVVVLGLELGAIPSYKDLTGIKQALANLTRDTIGVLPTVKEVVISPEEKVSQTDHDVLENARAILITNSQTDRARYLTLQQQYAALQLQYQQLETWVKNNTP